MATMTAAQQRAQAKVEYDAFLAACPSRKLLDRISDKWVTLILCALGNAGEPRAMRYSELSRLLAGVSQKMLTQTLRSLERDGLITRTATPTVPVTVTYELTGLGLSNGLGWSPDRSLMYFIDSLAGGLAVFAARPRRG